MKHYNFLFLMADQIRTATLEGMGDGIQTPNLRRLMDESVLFTRASCTSPLCTPSPACCQMRCSWIPSLVKNPWNG